MNESNLSVSVIIPTLNEQSCLAQTLERVAMDRPAEIIVADGGSTDETRQIAARWARVLTVPRGRAIQQNRAAATATGDVLLFLHADCWPEAGWHEQVVRAIERGCVAGCFQMRVRGNGLCYRLIERGGDLRARWLGMPYGDQGIFLRRQLFFQFGGFPRVSFMEDLLFMQSVRRVGRVRQIRHPIHVSARRWERTGIIRQTLRNWILTSLAIGAGIHPDRLARFYPAVR